MSTTIDRIFVEPAWVARAIAIMVPKMLRLVYTSFCPILPFLKLCHGQPWN